MSMLLISTYSRHCLDRSGIDGYFEETENHMWVFPHKVSTIKRLGECPINPKNTKTTELFIVTQEDETNYIVDADTLQKILDAQNNRYE